MAKKCPFCGKELPEKASFCLTCFSPLNAPIPISEEKGKSGFVPFLFSHRRALSIMAGVLAAVLTLTTLLYRPNTEPPSEGLPPIGNSTTTEDTAENTTRKENIWDQISNLFRPDKEETNPSGNDDLREEETKPQFTFPHFTLPNIFGSDESESTLSTNTTASATVPSTVTVPEAEKPTAPPTTEPEAPPQIEPQMWEYEAYPSTGNQITLTKYNGKAKHIVIPEKIDGKYVRGLKKGAIQNIPQTAKISLEDGKFPDYVTFNDGCIQNMPNLVSVDFQDAEILMWMNFAVGCYKLEQIQIGDPMYRFDNGGLYYRTSKGYELRFYCPGTKNKEFILPAWSNGIRADNLYENPYLKTIRYHKDFTFFPAQKDLAKSLENIFIESGSENGYSVDGVAFIPALTSSGRIYYSRYPANSKNKTFTVPKDAHMEFTTWDGDKIRNPYLETLYIPIGTSLAISNWNKISDYFPNLKTIYIETGHPSYEYYKTNFSGNVLLY